MQVGSLIFVVIVAIWAAYLLQHWVRRREDAAAGRSVEGFSQAMRVLEKRPLLPRTELRAPRPNSYAVKPAAPARATVDVKRAVPAGAARPSPLVARRASEAGAASLHLQHELAQQHPSDAHRGEVDRMPVSHSPQGAASTPRHRGPQRQQPTEGPQSGRVPPRVPIGQRRLRAALLLVALLWLPVSIVLAATGVLLWVSVPFALVTLVAVLYWLRTEAQADRAHRAKHQAGRAGARGDQRGGREAALPVLSSEDTQVISHRAIEEARRAADLARRKPAGAASRAHDSAAAASAHATAYATAADGVFDVQAAQTGGVPTQPAMPTPATEAAPGSWSPVPVPVPTYSLKAKAEPRYTDAGIPADVFDTPEFAEEADELDDRALFARRAVSG